MHMVISYVLLCHIRLCILWIHNVILKKTLKDLQAEVTIFFIVFQSILDIISPFVFHKRKNVTEASN